MNWNPIKRWPLASVIAAVMLIECGCTVAVTSCAVKSRPAAPSPATPSAADLEMQRECLDLYDSFMELTPNPFTDVVRAVGEDMAEGLAPRMSAQQYLDIHYHGHDMSILLEAKAQGDLQKDGWHEMNWRVVRIIPTSQKPER